MHALTLDVIAPPFSVALIKRSAMFSLDVHSFYRVAHIIEDAYAFSYTVKRGGIKFKKINPRPHIDLVVDHPDGIVCGTSFDYDF